MMTAFRSIWTSMLFLALAAVLQGCLTGQSTYDPPRASSVVENSITLEKSKDEVWKTLVTGLGKEFFVINNLDKDSGLINVSYTGDPEEFVDCGTISVWVSNARGRRDYVFPGSRARQEYEQNAGGNLVGATRTLQLEGRMNIVVQPAEESKTIVTVNTRYALTKNIDYYNPAAEIVGQGVSRWSDNESMAFNTGQTGRFPKGGTTCRCTGELERRVLDLVRPEPTSDRENPTDTTSEAKSE